MNLLSNLPIFNILQKYTILSCVETTRSMHYHDMLIVITGSVSLNNSALLALKRFFPMHLIFIARVNFNNLVLSP